MHLSQYAVNAIEVCKGKHVLHAHGESEIEDDEPHQPPHPHAWWWDYYFAIPRNHH